MLKSLLAAAFVLLGWSAQAKVIHVSPQALPGIKNEDQVRTISEAAKTVAAGDRVVMHGGVYRESVVVEASGTAEAPIVFEAAPAERVVVTGADHLTDWRREEGSEQVFSTPWPHRFIAWNKTHTHPGDDYHALTGRCEQVFSEHYPLRQVLSRDKLSRGTFFADLDAKRLYVWTANNADLGKRGSRVEAAVRQTIWENKGAHVHVRGLRFRYAANMAQHGAVKIAGDHNVLSDCVVEYTNSVGVSVSNANDVRIVRCVMQYNGQMGIGAGGAHGLKLTECTIKGNSTKGWNRDWEAGGSKFCLSRGIVIERCTFSENRGVGVWFDIGNERCEVNNTLIADNEGAGIFYEISYSLHAHDNVIVGNGFDSGAGAWGASAGIALSSSPECRIERNVLVGNKEGFAYREQNRATPRIGGPKGSEVAVWNHDQVVRNNVIAFNKDAQSWGWFDTGDARHWPEQLRAEMGGKAGKPEEDLAKDYQAKDATKAPAGLSLEKLKLDHGGNVYFAAPGQGLFHWGTAWGKNRKYARLDQVREELGMERDSVAGDPGFADYLTRDFRVRAGSSAAESKAYPQGEVPGVRLGID